MVVVWEGITLRFVDEDDEVTPEQIKTIFRK